MSAGAAPAFRGSMPRSTAELAAWHGTAPQVAAIEPDLPIVDAHHHLFGTAQDRVHYRREDLQTDLGGGHRVIGTVYVEAYHAGWRSTGPEALRPVGEVETIVALAREPLATPRGPCQLAAGIVAHADMTLGDDVVSVLDAHAQAAEGRLRGIRHCTATDSGTVGRFIAKPPAPEMLRLPAFRKACGAVGRQGLSLDVWAYHHQLGEVIELADACPQTPIVLDHVGGVIGVAEHAERKADVLSGWRLHLRELARRPNVHVKLGGLGMTVFGFGFEHREVPPTGEDLAQAWQPYIMSCIEAFGPDRCLFESNFPVDKQSCSYTAQWNAYKLATRSLTAGERDLLFRGSACRVYRLDLPA